MNNKELVEKSHKKVKKKKKNFSRKNKMNNKELIENSQKKYLIHIGICGFGNQLLGFKEACLIAKRTNRIIVKPIFIPHGTIRDKCRKYYKFDKVFDNKKFSSMFNSCSIDEIKHIKIENIYMNRHKNQHRFLSYYLKESEEYYNIPLILLNNK
jgi:hypothetical protein